MFRVHDWGGRGYPPVGVCCPDGLETSVVWRPGPPIEVLMVSAASDDLLLCCARPPQWVTGRGHITGGVEVGCSLWWSFGLTVRVLFK